MINMTHAGVSVEIYDASPSPKRQTAVYIPVLFTCFCSRLERDVMQAPAALKASGDFFAFVYFWFICPCNLTWSG